MPLYGVEPIVAEVVAKLKAELPAKLAALSAEYGDGVELPAPYDGGSGDDHDRRADAYWPYLRDPRLLPSYPAIVVFRGDQEDAPPDVGNEVKISYPIGVVPVVTDADLGQLTLRLERYIRAVREILAAEDSLAVGACICDGVGWTTPRFEDEETQEYLQAVPAAFLVTTYETP